MIQSIWDTPPSIGVILKFSRYDSEISTAQLRNCHVGRKNCSLKNLKGTTPQFQSIACPSGLQLQTPRLQPPKIPMFIPLMTSADNSSPEPDLISQTGTYSTHPWPAKKGTNPQPPPTGSSGIRAYSRRSEARHAPCAVIK